MVIYVASLTPLENTAGRYACRRLTFSGISDVEIENFDNAADLFAAILSKGIAMQVKRGLERENLESTEAISAQRAR